MMFVTSGVTCWQGLALASTNRFKASFWCRVADYLVMQQLRMEALHVIAQKADTHHLPLLQDALETSSAAAPLAKCVQHLKRRQQEQNILLRKP
jgi:hypothetical protein